MLYPVCSLHIGDLTLDFVHEVRIESSWRNLTDTCTIQLPRNLRVRTSPTDATPVNFEDVVQIGAPVRVEYGYGQANLRLEFVGYVTGLKPGPPIEIACQDEMYFLKRVSLPARAWPKATTQDIAEYIRAESRRTFGIQLLGDKPVNLGEFQIQKETGAAVFDRLRKDYGLRCFFRNQYLVIGDPYQERASATVPRHKLRFGQNIITNDLQYVYAADVHVQVHAVSLLAKTKRQRPQIEVTLPATDAAAADDGGEVRTYKFTGLSAAELRARATAILAGLKYTGYAGTLTTFGAPPIEHGDEVQLDDTGAAYPKGGATFSVDKVEKTFGINGSRRVVTLGPLISTP